MKSIRLEKSISFDKFVYLASYYSANYCFTIKILLLFQVFG